MIDLKESNAHSSRTIALVKAVETSPPQFPVRNRNAQKAGISPIIRVDSSFLILLTRQNLRNYCRWRVFQRPLV